MKIDQLFFFVVFCVACLWVKISKTSCTLLLQDELDSQEFLKCFLISSSIYFFCLVFVWGQRLSWLKLYLIKEALDSQQTNWTIVLCNQVKYLSENFCLGSKWVFVFHMKIMYRKYLYSLQKWDIELKICYVMISNFVDEFQN